MIFSFFQQHGKSNIEHRQHDNWKCYIYWYKLVVSSGTVTQQTSSDKILTVHFLIFVVFCKDVIIRALVGFDGSDCCYNSCLMRSTFLVCVVTLIVKYMIRCCYLIWAITCVFQTFNRFFLFINYVMVEIPYNRWLKYVFIHGTRINFKTIDPNNSYGHCIFKFTLFLYF